MKVSEKSRIYDRGRDSIHIKKFERKKIKISEVILITNKMRCKEDFKGYLTAMGFGSRQTPLSRSFS